MKVIKITNKIEYKVIDFNEMTDDDILYAIEDDVEENIMFSEHAYISKEIKIYSGIPYYDGSEEEIYNEVASSVCDERIFGNAYLVKITDNKLVSISDEEIESIITNLKKDYNLTKVNC